MVFQLLLVVKKIWMDLFLDSTHLNPHFDDEFAYFWGVAWLWDWISTEKVGLEALKTLKEKEATTVAAFALRIAGDSNHMFGDLSMKQWWNQTWKLVTYHQYVEVSQQIISFIGLLSSVKNPQRSMFSL